jgi:hypothetical protein
MIWGDTKEKTIWVICESCDAEAEHIVVSDLSTQEERGRLLKNWQQKGWTFRDGDGQGAKCPECSNA